MNWDAKLFLKINSLVGKSRWLDAFGRAGAEWAVIVMGAWYGAGGFIITWPDWRAGLAPAIIGLACFAIGWLIDLLIGLIVREPRPRAKYPEAKTLFMPLSDWKSFPSDHVMAAWLMLFLAIILGLPWAWALLPLALWVSWGRVYAGIHYPFDAVGGVAVAGLVAMLSYYLLVVGY